MIEVIIVSNNDLFNICLNELRKNNKNVNTDKFKIKDFESNVILYSRTICTGHDFYCATKVYFIGFKENFFETNEGKQLKSRFDRISPTYLC
jgi:hypothetical protein